ncbi:MAG: sugar phosphate isomerase/epimerase family protein [Lentisphaeria bacterium]|jgi:sugar phosphate isomerase/epimerase|nr:sugar phosphate isomerase/epimerase family protein [Lentisphaeria bacterium]
MAMKYSVVLNTLTTGYDGCSVWEHPHEMLQTIADAGYDGVDMDGEPDRIDRGQFNELRDLAFSMGLKVPALLGAWAPWHCGEERDLCSTDESVRRQGVEYGKRAIDLAAEFEQPPLFQLCACPINNEYPLSSTPIDTLRQQFVNSTAEIVEYAAPKGVNIAIEPVNKYEGHPGFLNDIPDALSVVDEIAADNLGVQADFYHMNMADGNFIETLRTMEGKLMHVHLTDSNRYLLGTGHLDFGSILQTLKELNFTGYLSLDSVPANPDWKTVVEQGISYLKQMEQ